MVDVVTDWGQVEDSDFSTEVLYDLATLYYK